MQDKSEVVREQVMEHLQNSSDPKDKTWGLMTLHIADSLKAQSVAITRLADRMDQMGEDFYTHRDDFNDHRTKEEGFLNRIRGAWSVIAWVIGIAQIVLFSAYAYHTSQHDRSEARIDKVERWVEGHNQHHQTEEKHTKYLNSETKQ